MEKVLLDVLRDVLVFVRQYPAETMAGFVVFGFSLVALIGVNGMSKY